MYKLVMLYRKVDDEGALETFFSGTHLPHAEQLPGLLGSEVVRIDGKPGGDSRFHMSYSLYFESHDAMYGALQSEAGINMLLALKGWLDAGVISWYYGTAMADKHSSQDMVTPLTEIKN